MDVDPYNLTETKKEIPMISLQKEETLEKNLSQAIRILIKETDILKSMEEELKELNHQMEHVQRTANYRYPDKKTELIEKLITKTFRKKGKGLLNKFRKETHLEIVLEAAISRIEEIMEEAIAKDINPNDKHKLQDSLKKIRIYQKKILVSFSKEGSLYQKIKVIKRTKKLGLDPNNTRLLQEFSDLYDRDLRPLLILLEALQDKARREYRRKEEIKNLHEVIEDELKHFSFDIKSIIDEMKDLEKAPDLKMEQPFYSNLKNEMEKVLPLITTLTDKETHPKLKLKNIKDIEKTAFQSIEKIVAQANKATRKWIINELTGNLIRNILSLIVRCKAYRGWMNELYSDNPNEEIIVASVKLLLEDRRLKKFYINAVNHWLEQLPFAYHRFRHSAVG
jgi:hypothetical protein